LFIPNFFQFWFGLSCAVLLTERVELDLQDQRQGGQPHEGAKYQKAGLRYAALDDALEGDRLARVGDLVVVGLHVGHNLAGLFSESLSLFGVRALGHKGLSLDLGLGGTLDSRPETGKGGQVKAENDVVGSLAVGDFSGGARDVIGGSRVCDGRQEAVADGVHGVEIEGCHFPHRVLLVVAATGGDR
jgi:hypothetical protein